MDVRDKRHQMPAIGPAAKRSASAREAKTAIAGAAASIAAPLGQDCTHRGGDYPSDGEKTLQEKSPHGLTTKSHARKQKSALDGKDRIMAVSVRGAVSRWRVEFVLHQWYPS